MCTILAVGKDIDLLYTRSRVLSQTGADIVMGNLDEALRILKARPIDLVVLCHTLSQPEMVEIASLARQRNPATRMLQLVAVRSEVSPPELAADAVTTAQPQLLIAKVTQMLES